jgi:hypothetical protein
MTSSHRRLLVATGVFVAVTAAIVFDFLKADLVTRLGPFTQMMPDLGRYGMLRGGSLYLLWSLAACAFAAALWSSPVAASHHRVLRILARVAITLVIVFVVVTLWYTVLLSIAEG